MANTNYDANSTPNTIKLKLHDLPFEKEAGLATGTTITPGQVLEFATATTVQPTSTTHVKPVPFLMVAVEFGIDGRGIDDAYQTAGETVVYNIFAHGEEFYGWLANGQNVAAGDLLDVDGSGNLVAGSAYASGELARALQSVNNTSGSPVRIMAEVL